MRSRAGLLMTGRLSSFGLTWAVGQGACVVRRLLTWTSQRCVEAFERGAEISEQWAVQDSEPAALCLESRMSGTLGE
jgi:hypothetical protein